MPYRSCRKGPPMSTQIPEFERAEYVGEPSSPSQAQRLRDDFNSRTRDAQQSDRARFTKAILYGTVAAVVGCVVYSAFTIVTHIEIGYLAVGVGYLIGRAMLHATEGSGGRRYQVTSAFLTYVSVAMAAVSEILWKLRSDGTDIAHLRPSAYVELAKYGVASPFLELQHNLVSGLIGIFILFIGVRAAWQFTAYRPTAHNRAKRNG